MVFRKILIGLNSNSFGEFVFPICLVQLDEFRISKDTFNRPKESASRRIAFVISIAGVNRAGPGHQSQTDIELTSPSFPSIPTGVNALARGVPEFAFVCLGLYT